MEKCTLQVPDGGSKRDKRFIDSDFIKQFAADIDIQILYRCSPRVKQITRFEDTSNFSSTLKLIKVNFSRTLKS